MNRADQDSANILQRTASHPATLQHQLRDTATLYRCHSTGKSGTRRSCINVPTMSSLAQCNALQHTLQHTATHCNTLQHTATLYRCHSTGKSGAHRSCITAPTRMSLTHCNALQHTLQYGAIYFNTLQHSTDAIRLGRAGCADRVQPHRQGLCCLCRDPAHR